MDVAATLTTSAFIQDLCECKHGMYFLKGNESYVWERHDRYIFAERKYRKAHRAAWLFARLPFVRMVAVVNTLAFSASRDDGDIDFLIVAERGYLWLVRALTTFFMEVAGSRPRKGHMRDAICLSFFLSDDSLNLEHLLLLEKDGTPDVYLCMWTASCVPLYSEKEMYPRFYVANTWVEHLVPHRSVYTLNQRRKVSLGKTSPVVKKTFEWILSRLSWLERSLQRLQLAILPDELREAMNKDTRVVLNNQMIKCHPNDRREEIRKAFIQKFGKMV